MVILTQIAELALINVNSMEIDVAYGLSRPQDFASSEALQSTAV